MNSTRIVHTVSELNQLARSLLEEAFPSLWLEGEISNFSRQPSGHWYFTLKDANAQVRCAMFQGRNRALGFEPKNGAQVLVRARVSLYTVRGEFQLIVDFMEEAGDGALRRAFELLKAQLAAEGLFDPIHKKPLPTLAKTIGVITSPTGAAIRDILSILKRRFPAIGVIIYPTLVQGALASGQIVQALQTANQRKECDLLILARGGGSLEDLWPFNEENVARAIFASELPVISAVGHEIDFTIADFVADYRAATPSAAAELASPDRQEWLQLFNQLYLTLARQINLLINQRQQQLLSLSKRLRHPGQRLQEQAQRLDDIEQRLGNAMLNTLQRKQQQLAGVSRALDAVSPLATLNRGYAIITDASGQNILRHAAQTKQGDLLRAQLADGGLLCKVEEIISAPPHGKT